MSEIKVNKISPKQTCTQLTLGDSGDTIIIPAGATITNNGTATGFGRTGTVDWDTTPKTTTVTAVSGTGYFINTTSGAITVNLPVGSAGSIVAVSDYANTAATNNITITPNGADKINGLNKNTKITTNGASATLLYVDSTRGWKDINDATLDLTGISDFVTATGGTITTCGNYKIHTFTGPGTFTVTGAGTPAGSTTVDYLVVAGGGGGGGGGAGSGGGSGAGAGGFRTNYPSSCAGIPVSVTAYPITVGAGGTGGAGTSSPPGNGVSGSNSIFSTITAAGGGGGKYGPCYSQAGEPGGSGSGASGGTPGDQPGGTGNTPPVSPPQGNPGGSGAPYPQPAPQIFSSAGGGGAGGAGGGSGPGPRQGGVGSANSISGSPVTYSRGGTGGTYDPPTTPISPEPANSGNGGFGKSSGPGGGVATTGATGGSGIVVIRYKFQ
jgi:hypothetical protein